MTDLSTAAQQALEALDMYAIETDSEFQRKAIIALRAALAQQAELKGGGRLPPPLQTEPVPQPGVWMHPWPPVRAQQAEPVQEPVAVVGTQVDVWRGCDGRWAPPGEPIKTALMLKDIPVGTMLYTAPPRCPNCASLEAQNNELDRKLAELERAHGIKE